MPTFLADGDAATVFVRPEPDGHVVITDLGQTCMRLSDLRTITATETEQVQHIVGQHGFKFEDGQIFARAYPKDLFAFVKQNGARVGIALVPSEADAERAVATKLMLAPLFLDEAPQMRWLALPRNLEQLPKKTQARVESAFEVPLRAIQRPGPGLSNLLRNQYLVH